MSSVLVNNRNKSRVEVITFAEDLHAMLDDLMRRNFGIKDTDDFVRRQYAHGRIEQEDFSYYRYKLSESKRKINELCSRLENCLRAAYYRYPSSEHELEIRRDNQNDAIVCCEMVIGELQKVAETFEVDLNLFAPHIKAIDREIGLIKDWRRRDNNKFKSRFK